MQSAQEIIETYLRAKDENRPYLMERAFAENARLEMVVNSGTMAFPPIANGLESITDTLVRRFGATCENVRTFCLASPPRHGEVRYSCPWLVGMSEKESRMVRVGCGRYDWLFHSHAPGLAERLTITIDLMQTFAPNCLSPVMHWLSQLPYPWCAVQPALTGMPTLDELQPIRRYLARESARPCVQR